MMKKSDDKLKTKAFLYWDNDYKFITFAVCLPGTTRVVYTEELTPKESEQYRTEIPDENTLAFSEMVWHNTSIYQTIVRKTFTTTYNEGVINASDFVTSVLDEGLDLGIILNIPVEEKKKTMLSVVR
jgi:hypothetical protein